MARYDFPIVGFNKLQNSWADKFYNAIGLALLLEAYSANHSEPDQKGLKAFLIANLIINSSLVARYNTEIVELILARDFKNLKQMLSRLEPANKARLDSIKTEMEVTLGIMIDSGWLDQYNTRVQSALKFFIASKVAKEFVKLHKLDKTKAINNKYKAQLKRSLLDSNMHIGDIGSEMYSNITSNYCASSMWMSASPEDEACIGPTGEVRKTGQPFSNGLIAPPVHYGCACYLVPVK